MLSWEYSSTVCCHNSSVFLMSSCLPDEKKINESTPEKNPSETPQQEMEHTKVL